MKEMKGLSYAAWTRRLNVRGRAISIAAAHALSVAEVRQIVLLTHMKTSLII